MKMPITKAVALSAIATSALADSSITCSGEKAWHLSSNQITPLTQSFDVTFNSSRITSISHVCETAKTNIVSDNELHLVCVQNSRCAKNNQPNTTYLTINRTTGKYTMYLACLGLQNEGSCRTVAQKF